ncbi:hypothetical protein F7P83_11920 [Brevibacterium luteolum]|nr:hypothetical protein [Brevibacterium luteolum]
MTAVSPQTLFIDFEGTVYTREGVVPRAPETLDELRSAGHNLRFLTNTDSVATSTIVQRVHDLGLDIGPEEVFTPVTAARVLLAREDDVRVLALTSTSVAAELSEQLTLVDAAASPTHVVVGGTCVTASTTGSSTLRSVRCTPGQPSWRCSADASTSAEGWRTSTLVPSSLPQSTRRA